MASLNWLIVENVLIYHVFCTNENDLIVYTTVLTKSLKTYSRSKWYCITFDLNCIVNRFDRERERAKLMKINLIKNKCAHLFRSTSIENRRRFKIELDQCSLVAVLTDMFRIIRIWQNIIRFIFSYTFPTKFFCSEFHKNWLSKMKTD